MSEKEHELLQTIEKLKKQLDYHCKDCQSSDHSDFLNQVIDDLQQELRQLQTHLSYARIQS